MHSDKFDPIEIHHAIIDSWIIYAIYSTLSFSYVVICPHLLPDEWGIAILSGGVALLPITFAAFLFWMLEKRWENWFDFLR